MPRAVLLLLALALAACGPDGAYHVLSCRNAVYADPGVKAALAAGDPDVQRRKDAVYDDCSAKLNPNWDPGDRGPVFRPR